MNHGARHAPVAHDAALADSQTQGRIGYRQAGEEAQLDDLHQAGVELSEAFQAAFGGNFPGAAPTGQPPANPFMAQAQQPVQSLRSMCTPLSSRVSAPFGQTLSQLPQLMQRVESQCT